MLDTKFEKNETFLRSDECKFLNMFLVAGVIEQYIEKRKRSRYLFMPFNLRKRPSLQKPKFYTWDNFKCNESDDMQKDIFVFRN